MWIVLSPIFVADAKIILGYNFGVSSKMVGKYDKN